MVIRRGATCGAPAYFNAEIRPDSDATLVASMGGLGIHVRARASGRPGDPGRRPSAKADSSERATKLRAMDAIKRPTTRPARNCCSRRTNSSITLPAGRIKDVARASAQWEMKFGH